MAQDQVNKAGRFVVDLGSLELKPEVADRIESAVRQAVLSTIAGLDLEHDVRIGLNPGWRGLVIRLPKGGLGKLNETLHQ